MRMCVKRRTASSSRVWKRSRAEEPKGQTITCLLYTSIRRCTAVFDAVYNPDETVLLKTAEQLGKTAVHGIGMLCGQAAAAQELWGIPPCSRGALLALCREAVTEMNRRFGEGQG